MKLQFSGYVVTDSDKNVVFDVRDVQVVEKGQQITKQVGTFKINVNYGKDKDGNYLPSDLVRVTVWGSPNVEYLRDALEQNRFVTVTGTKRQASEIWESGDKKGINFDITAEEVLVRLFPDARQGKATDNAPVSSTATKAPAKKAASAPSKKENPADFF